jgi:hypothetical protein
VRLTGCATVTGGAAAAAGGGLSPQPDKVSASSTISGLKIGGLGLQDDSIMKVSLWVRQFLSRATASRRHQP